MWNAKRGILPCYLHHIDWIDLHGVPKLLWKMDPAQTSSALNS
jgi:hypothetical protein